jgi:hypothetical protein
MRPSVVSLFVPLFEFHQPFFRMAPTNFAILAVLYVRTRAVPSRSVAPMAYVPRRLRFMQTTCNIASGFCGSLKLELEALAMVAVNTVESLSAVGCVGTHQNKL